MKLWMHGCGPNPQEGARHLKDLGFSVVVGGQDAAEAVLAQGMEYYICTGAYRGPQFQGDEWLAEDMWGRKQAWFSSTCPTREEVRQYNLQQIRRLAATKGIRGILIDGARFASPASGEPEAFYTCFCPHCMEKARRMGFDVKEMRIAASMLYDFQHGKPLDLVPYYAGLKEWFEFRRAATTEHLLDFVQAVKEVNPELETGIYIFAPALADLVGQHYRDLARHMDIMAPMLYHCYADENGPACLNVELATMLRMLEGASGLTTERRIRLLSGLTGHELTGYESVSSLQAGLSNRILQRETERARIMGPDTQLVPIIQLDAPDIEEAIQKTMAGGADAVNFFVYQQAQAEALRPLWERLRQ